MGASFRVICGASVAALANVALPCAAGPVLVKPTTLANSMQGIGLSQWSQTTADLSAVAPVMVSSTALSDAKLLNSYDGVWIDLGQTTQSLSSTEAANLSAFVQSGRRAVLIGESSTFAMWDSSILAAVGGSFASANYSGSTPVRSYVRLTTGVSALSVSQGGLAAGGTSLFTDKVVMTFGPAANAAVVLDADALADASMGSAGNVRFASNLTAWVAGGLGITASWNAAFGGTWSSGTWSTGLMPSVADTARFNLGQNAATAGGYTVNVASPVAVGSVTVAADKVTLATASSLAVSGAITIAPPANQIGALTFTAAQPAVTSAASIYVGGAAGSTATLTVGPNVSLNVTGDVTLATGGSLQLSGGRVSGGGAIGGPGTISQTAGTYLATSIRTDSLTLSGGTVAIAPQSAAHSPDSVSVLNTLFIADTNGVSLDLGNSDLIVQHGDLPALTVDVLAGRLTTGGGDEKPLLFLNDNGLGQRLYGSGAPLGLFDGQDPALDAVLVQYASVAVPEPTAAAWAVMSLVALGKRRRVNR